MHLSDSGRPDSVASVGPFPCRVVVAVCTAECMVERRRRPGSASETPVEGCHKRAGRRQKEKHAFSLHLQALVGGSEAVVYILGRLEKGYLWGTAESCLSKGMN